VASGWLAEHGWNAAELRLGIWGKPKTLDTPLRERDRIEIYRPLLVDPKEARRQRYRKQRAAAKATQV
jgi:putative ubiquitin-RnfH superfamily antitoxin RatB of RatAB toxin-antitoxin module